MTKIYVGNLDFEAGEPGVRDLFQAFGDVASVEIPTDWETGHSRGFAFVIMRNESEAGTAISELSGTSWNGRSLVVREAPKVPANGFRSLALDQ